MTKSNKPMIIYDFIRQYMNQNGYPPSVREICTGVGLSSTSTVHLHLATLENQGYLRRNPSRPRALEILHDKNQSQSNTTSNPGNYQNPLQQDNIIGNEDSDSSVSIPVVGQVTAGEPILAEENIQEYFPLPSQMIKGKHPFMLQIKGDSMKDAGILNGDYVIVNKQQTANNGEIVVALLEDEATVKRFYKETDCIRLQPENPAYNPIYGKGIQVIGKVIGLFRSVI